MPVTLIQQHAQKIFFLFYFYVVIHIRNFFSYLYFVDFLQFLWEKCHKGTPSKSQRTERSVLANVEKKIYEKLGEQHKLWHEKSVVYVPW